MAKQPYIPLYTGDYLKDTRRLPLEVRGAWVDIMIFMWESKEKGTITGTMEEFSLMLGCSFKKANSIIATLQEKGICDYKILANGHIKLICRRIVRDVELSEKRKAAGTKGGNPNLLNQNPTKPKTNGYPFSDNDIDNDNPSKEKESTTSSLPVVDVPRGTPDESLHDVECWTQDVIDGNDEQFTMMVSNRRVPVNGQLEPLARSHLGLCSRYGWYKRMETQQAFRNSLIDHITKELENKKHAPNKGNIGTVGPEPGKDYTQGF